MSVVCVRGMRLACNSISVVVVVVERETRRRDSERKMRVFFRLVGMGHVHMGFQSHFLKMEKQHSSKSRLNLGSAET